MTRQFQVLLLPLALLLVADGAAAFRGGRIDFSGRERSCLECHGSRQYDGLQFSLGSVAGTEPCGFVNAEGEFQVAELPLLEHGKTYPATVEIPLPTGNNVPVCPTNDCCDPANPPQEGDACLNRPGARGGPMICTPDDFLAGCCEPGLDECTDANGNPLYQAGFNAEDAAGGTFEPGDDGDTQLLPREGELVTNQITHTNAKLFNGAGVKWAFHYTPPSIDTGKGVEIYVGANVANGNFLDDNGDLNSNYRYAAVVTDGERYAYPGYCQICPDGRSSLDGSCCSCMSTGTGSDVYSTFAMLGFLAFLATGNRRRRRRQ